MSKQPILEARTAASQTIDTDVIAVFQDTGKKAIPPKGAYGSAVEALRKSNAFAGGAGTIQFLRFGGKGGAENALLLGLGAPVELTEDKMRTAGGNVWSKLKAEKSGQVAVQLDSLFESKGIKSESSHAKLVRAFSEGIVLAAYSFDKYKSKKESTDDYQGPSKISFITREKTLQSQLGHELEQVQAVGEAVQVTRDWSNEPSNHGTPEYYAGEAKKLAKKYGLKYRVLTEAECAREKMGLFVGVGQGAEREGRFVILEYNPRAKSTKTVALVGKGITFDSGGTSIKPSMKMEDMKHDMTGAATVMGSLILASLWGISNRVIGIMAFTENMPDGNAIQPGNVLTSRSGKTVEIINTDAEGRLILADALDFAQDYKPDAIVDIATLTGAVSVALGKQCCAVLGNEESLIDSLIRAGEANSEKIWQLPIYDEYFDDLKSDCADMKNSANDPYGGTIRGAIFLKQFIKKNQHWAHLDIAAMAYAVSHLSYIPKKGASGLYVRTLAQFAADY